MGWGAWAGPVPGPRTEECFVFESHRLEQFLCWFQDPALGPFPGSMMQKGSPGPEEGHGAQS